MKKIKFKTEKKPTVNFEDLNDDSIVGFVCDSKKKLIVRTSNGFCSITDDKVDLRLRGKEWRLKKYVEALNKLYDKEALFYQFETIKEALKWLSE